jgi:hypothetical protein
MNIINIDLSESDIFRFWQKVNRKTKTECWEWLGAKNHEGYGRFKVKGKILSPHRISLSLATSTISTNEYACHRCDNPSCCNPNHLFFATQSQNMKDCQKKRRNCFLTQKQNLSKGGKREQANRYLFEPKKGSTNGSAKLNEGKVQEIKCRIKEGVSSPLIAKEFAVSRQLINLIRRGKLWKHVEDPFEK